MAYTTSKRSLKDPTKTRHTGMYRDLRGKPKSAGTFDNREEALAAAEAEERRLNENLGGVSATDRRDTTLAKFWPFFRKHHPVKLNTMQQYQGVFFRHIEPYLGRKTVAGIDGPTLRQFFQILRDGAEVPVRTRQSVKAVLSAMFNVAVQFGYREDVPVKGITVGRQGKKPIKIIDQDQWEQLYDALETPVHKLFAETLVSTGVRYCEVVGFEEGDLDYATGMLTVSKSVAELTADMHPTGGKFYVAPYTKNGEQRRFKVNEGLARKIHAHVLKYGIQPGELIFRENYFMEERHTGSEARYYRSRPTAEEMAEAQKTFITSPSGIAHPHGTRKAHGTCACRCRYCNEAFNSYRRKMDMNKLKSAGLYYPRTKRDESGYLAKGTWSRIWITARNKVGLPITPYELRHTHASWLMAAGVALSVIQHRLGHNDLSSTTHYIGILAESNSDAADVMSRAMGYKQETPVTLTAEQEQRAAVIRSSIDGAVAGMIDPALLGQLIIGMVKQKPEDKEGIVRAIVSVVA